MAGFWLFMPFQRFHSSGVSHLFNQLSILFYVYFILIYYILFCRYHQASDEGCARSTYLLGHLFMKGKLSASKAHTFALLQQAAKSGQMEAFYCLGTCYEQGIGAEVDIDLAVLHYRRGAKLGSKLGMYSLGYLLVQNAIEARRKLKQLRPYASDRSHATTTNSVVVVESNPEDEQYAAMVEEAEGMLQEGIHWLRAASENHIKDAAFQLGRLYEQVLFKLCHTTLIYIYIY